MEEKHSQNNNLLFCSVVADITNGMLGTYTKPNVSSTVWTEKP